MSKITCRKCGAQIKIKTLFLERAGCENCGNSIDFTTMSSLSGLRQGLMFAAAAIVGIVALIVALKMHIRLNEIPKLFMSMSAQAAAMLLMGALLLVLAVATVEKIIGCRIYEKERIREEEAERAARERETEEENEEQA